MVTNNNAAIQNFFEQWEDTSGMKALCGALYTHMAGFSGLRLEFVARPGVSYSIRLLGQGRESIAALLDIIDDDPEERWLSLCFPDAIVTDPDGEGDQIPKGLNGNDARCFSIDAIAEGTEAYLTERLSEAAAKTA